MTEFTFTPHGSKYDKDKPYEQHKDESVPVQLKDGSYALMDFVLHYQTCFGQGNIRQDVLDQVGKVTHFLLLTGARMVAEKITLGELVNSVSSVEQINKLEATINSNIAGLGEKSCLQPDGVGTQQVRLPGHLEITMPDP